MDQRATRRLLGVRRQPGRLALAVFRLPLPLYRNGWGWLFGHTFLLVTHAGRKTGRRRETVAMVLKYDPQTKEAIICSAWGPNTDWIRNIRARPALQIQIGRRDLHTRATLPLPRRERCGGGSVPPPAPPPARPVRHESSAGATSSTDAGHAQFVRARPFISFAPARLSPLRSLKPRSEIEVRP